MLDAATLQGMISGIKATENIEELEAQIKAGVKEEKKVKDEQSRMPLTVTKFNSMVTPNTQKAHAKKLYSPLGEPKKMRKEKPYIIGICGGPSSGKSSVAKIMKSKLPEAVILNLIHFYKPIRGNLRRRSRADSIIEDQEKGEEEIKSDIRDAYRKNDFDSPDAIDWNLLNKGVNALSKG